MPRAEYIEKESTRLVSFTIYYFIQNIYDWKNNNFETGCRLEKVIRPLRLRFSQCHKIGLFARGFYSLDLWAKNFRRRSNENQELTFFTVEFNAEFKKKMFSKISSEMSMLLQFLLRETTKFISLEIKTVINKILLTGCVRWFTIQNGTWVTFLQAQKPRAIKLGVARPLNIVTTTNK